MDDSELERGRRLEALSALSRINRISLAGNRLWREIVTLKPEVKGPVRVLDLACGGGDLLNDVADKAQRLGLPVELRGCDLSEVAVERARAGAPRGGSIDFFQLDILEDDLPPDYDLVTSSLFLHHLERREAIRFLRRMGEATRRGIFVQDLRRTRLGYFLAWIGLRTLTRSDVARVDGLRSVRGAFTIAETRVLCAEAGLQGARVARRWPQRFTIRWRRSDTG